MAFDYTKLFSVSGLILLVGVVFTILAIKTKGKIMGMAKGLVVSGMLVVAVVGLYGTGVLSDYGIGAKTLAVGDVPATQTAPSTSALPQQTSAPPTTQDTVLKNVGGRICREQSDGTNSLNVVVRNGENSSLSYLAGTIAAESDTSGTLDSGTSTGGATLSSVTLNVKGCEEGYVYLLGTTGIGTASARTRFSSFDPVSVYGTNGNEFLSAGQSVISVEARDSALVEASSGTVNGSVGDDVPPNNMVSGTGTADGTAYVTNQSLGANGNINGYVDWQVNGTSSVFGVYGASDGSIFSFDSGTAARFSANALTLSDTTGVGLKQITAQPGQNACPATVIANRNAETCWTARTLKASDGQIRFKYQLRADLGDPVQTDTMPKLCADDKVFFRDTNGKIAYDFFSSAGTNQGVGGTCVQWVLS